MPDHLHLVVEAIDSRADLVQFVSLFKQRTGYVHRRRTASALWQAGFYDRVLRKDEATATAVQYVLANPVRAGLARTIGEWPFSGSDGFNMTDVDWASSAMVRLQGKNDT